VSPSTDIRGVVNRILERLVTSYRPQKVVWYGSHTRGHGAPDSDIDLLIVKDTAQPFLDRIDEVRRLASGTHPRIPFDPLVLTTTEVRERLRRGDQFIAQILESGEVLYAA